MYSIDLKLEKEELYRLNDFIEKIISKKDAKIELILEEVFVNILNYSNSDFLKVFANHEKNRLKIEFIDNGMKFNPLSKEDPEFPDSVEDAKVGGLGLFLTKSFADCLHYEYKNGENHFILIKETDD